MAQFARPDADQAVGLWTTAPLWSKVDEGTPGDNTVITSGNNTSGDNADLRLSNVTDPVASTGHVIRFRGNKSAANGHVVNAVIELWQGIPGTGSLIATLTQAAINETEAEYTHTLSSTEADSITDYTDLYLRVSRQGDTGGAGGSRRSLICEFVELEVPDATAAPSPGVGAVTLTGFVPSVLLAVAVGVGAGALGSTGFAPSLQVGQGVSPGVGTVAAAGLAPTVAVSDHRTVAPGLGTVAAAGFAPSLSLTEHRTAEPSAGSVAVTGFAPTASSPPVLRPGAGTLTISGFAPTVQFDLVVSPDTGSVVVTGLAPTITIGGLGDTVSPGVGSVGATGFAPTLAFDRVVTPSVGTVAITGLTPTVGMSLVIPVGVGSLVVTGSAPILPTPSQIDVVGAAETTMTVTGQAATALTVTGQEEASVGVTAEAESSLTITGEVA